jgi:predicted phage terminase large subunit-like protein
MESGCPEIHIATRWSNKDPIGMILESADGEKYEQIVIPALLEDGKSFCEEVRTTKEYLDTKAGIDSVIWESVYMQHPIEAKGLLFPIDQLRKFELKELNEGMIDAIIGFTDTADEGTDYLASLSVALSGTRAFLVNVVFTQDPVEVTESLVARQIIDDGHSKHVVESNAGGKGFGRNIKRLVEEGESDCHVTWRPSTQNKETRILMSSGQIKRDFWFRSDYEHGSMYDRFMRQLCSYVKMGTDQPDDAPDALTGVAEMVFRPGMRFLNSTQQGSD